LFANQTAYKGSKSIVTLIYSSTVALCKLVQDENSKLKSANEKHVVFFNWKRGRRVENFNRGQKAIPTLGRNRPVERDLNKEYERKHTPLWWTDSERYSQPKEKAQEKKHKAVL